MYEITVDDQTTTADALLGALDELRDRLRPVLLDKDQARWRIIDPAGTEYGGIDYLNGRTDRLERLLDDTCDDLYVQLHRSVDGYGDARRQATTRVAPSTVSPTASPASSPPRPGL